MESPSLLKFDSSVIPDADVSEWGREGSIYDISLHPEMLEKQKQALKKYNPKKQLRFTWNQQI